MDFCSDGNVLEKRERGRIQGLPIFSGTPCYLRNGNSYGFHIWPVHSEVDPNKSPLKIFAKRERGRIQGLPNFWVVPPSYYLMNGKSYELAHLYRLNRNKSPLKIWGKVAMGIVRDSRKFSGHPSHT